MSQFGHSAIDLVLAMLEDCVESIRNTGIHFSSMRCICKNDVMLTPQS